MLCALDHFIPMFRSHRTTEIASATETGRSARGVGSETRRGEREQQRQGKEKGAITTAREASKTLAKETRGRNERRSFASTLFPPLGLWCAAALIGSDFHIAPANNRINSFSKQRDPLTRAQYYTSKRRQRETCPIPQTCFLQLYSATTVQAQLMQFRIRNFFARRILENNCFGSEFQSIVSFEYVESKPRPELAFLNETMSKFEFRQSPLH